MARTSLSSLISGFWLVAIMPARVFAAVLPTRAAGSWLFMITMTCRFTFCDSWAASAGVIGAVATFMADGAAGGAGRHSLPGHQRRHRRRRDDEGNGPAPGVRSARTAGPASLHARLIPKAAQTSRCEWVPAHSEPPARDLMTYKAGR